VRGEWVAAQGASEKFSRGVSTPGSGHSQAARCVPDFAAAGTALAMVGGQPQSGKSTFLAKLLLSRWSPCTPLRGAVPLPRPSAVAALRARSGPGKHVSGPSHGRHDLRAPRRLVARGAPSDPSERERMFRGGRKLRSDSAGGRVHGGGCARLASFPRDVPLPETCSGSFRQLGRGARRTIEESTPNRARYSQPRPWAVGVHLVLTAPTAGA